MSPGNPPRLLDPSDPFNDLLGERGQTQPAATEPTVRMGGFDAPIAEPAPSRGPLPDDYRKAIPKPDLPRPEQGQRLAKAIRDRAQWLRENDGRSPGRALKIAIQEAELMLQEDVPQNWQSHASRFQGFVRGQVKELPDGAWDLPPGRVLSNYDYLAENPDQGEIGGGLLGQLYASIVEPIGNVGWGFLQHGFVDPFTGLTGSEPIDLKNKARAGVQRALGNKDAGEEKERALAEGVRMAAPWAGVAQDIGSTVGSIGSYFTPTTATGALFKGGGKLAEKAWEFSRIATGLKLSPKVAQYLQATMSSAGGFALNEFVNPSRTPEQQTTESGTFKPPTMAERLEGSAWGAASGAAFHAFGEVGKAAARGIARKMLGIERGNAASREVRTMFEKWLRENNPELAQRLQQSFARLKAMHATGAPAGELRAGMEQLRRDAADAFQQSVNVWLDKGAPGLGKAPMKLVMAATRGGLEAAGFSALDAEFRSHLFEGVSEFLANGETKNLAKAMERYTVNALSLAALHGIGMRDSYNWMRSSPKSSKPPKAPGADLVPQDRPQGPQGAAPQQPAPQSRDGGIPVQPTDKPLQLSPEVANRTPEQAAADNATLDSIAPRSRESEVDQIVAEVNYRRAQDAPREREAKWVGDQPIRAGYRPEEGYNDFTMQLPSAEQARRESLYLRAEDLIRLGWEPVPETKALPAPMPGPPTGQAGTSPVSVAIRLVGSPHRVDVQEGMATVSGELAEILGMMTQKSAPVQEVMDRVYVASLMNQLQAKALFGADQLSTAGEFGYPTDGVEPGRIYRLVFGIVQHRDVAPDSEWRETPLDELPSRPEPAERTPEMEEALTLLTALRNARDDIAPTGTAFADQLSEVIRTRGMTDDGARDLVEFLGRPEVLQALEGTPQQAMKTLLAAAEIATHKDIDVLAEDFGAGRAFEPPAFTIQLPASVEAGREMAPGAASVIELPGGGESPPAPEQATQGAMETPVGPPKSEPRAGGKPSSPDVTDKDLALRAEEISKQVAEPSLEVGARVYEELARLEEVGFEKPIRQDWATKPAAVEAYRNYLQGMGTVLGNVKSKRDWIGMAEPAREMLEGIEGQAMRFSPEGQAIRQRLIELGEQFGWPTPERDLEVMNSGINPLPMIGMLARMATPAPVRRALKLYYTPLVNDLMQLGAAVEAEQVRRAMTMASYFYRQLEPKLFEFLQKTKRPRKIRELDTLLSQPASASGHVGQVTTYAALKDQALMDFFGLDRAGYRQQIQDVLTLADELTNDTGAIAMSLGVKRPDGTPFQWDPNRRIGVRLMTDEMIEELRDSGPGAQAFFEIVSEWNGISIDSVRQSFDPQTALVSRDATEMTRTIQVIPSRILMANGRVLQVFEDQPFEHISQLVASNVQRMGFLSQFPQEFGGQQLQFSNGMPVPPSSRNLINSVGKKHGPDAALRMTQIVQAMHGIPIEPPGFGRLAKPGEASYEVLRVIGAAMRGWRAGKLSRAFVPNLFEAGASPSYFLGARNIMQSTFELASAWVRGDIRNVLERLRSQGFINRADNVTNYRVKGPSRVRSLENASRVFSRLLLKPLRVVSEGTSAVIGLAAEKSIADMRAGNGTERHIDMMRAMGIPEIDARRIASGGGTPIEYGELAGRVEATLMGGFRQQGPERSRASHSKAFSRLIFFTDYFQKRALHMASIAKGLRAKSPQKKTEAMGRLLRFLGYSTATGVASGAAYVLLFQGASAMWSWFAELLEDPWEGTKTTLLQGLAGGPGMAAADIAEGKGFLNTIARVIGPLSAIEEGGQLAAALMGQSVPGSPYNGQDTFEVIATAFGRQIPLAQSVREGMFGASFLALDGSPKLEAAMDSFNRWMVHNDKYGQGGVASHGPGFDEVKEIVRELRVAGMSVTDEVIDAVRNALTTANRDEVVRRLAARAPIGGYSWNRLTDQERQSLMRHLGPDHMQVLRHYSAVMTSLVRPRSRG